MSRKLLIQLTEKLNIEEDCDNCPVERVHVSFICPNIAFRCIGQNKPLGEILKVYTFEAVHICPIQ